MTTPDQAAPAATAPTSAPRLAWLWVGVAVAVLAAGAAVALSAARDEPEPGASGPGAVSIEVAKGGSYGVYFPAGDRPAFAASLSCRIAVGSGAATPVVLDEWGGGYDGPQRTEFGRSWDAVGDFTSPLSGAATVSCDDAASGLMVRHVDEGTLGVGGAVVAAVLLSLAGAVLAIAVVITRVRRRRTGPGSPGDGTYRPDDAAYNPPPSFERGPGPQQGPW